MKKNKGYTTIDLVIAIVIIIISIDLMTMYVIKTIQNIQAIKFGVISASCMTEIAESIEAYSYENINDDLQYTLRNTLKIPEEMQLSLNVEEKYTGYIKIVMINLKYTVNGKEENFNIKKIKVVEV